MLFFGPAVTNVLFLSYDYIITQNDCPVIIQHHGAISKPMLHDTKVTITPHYAKQRQQPYPKHISNLQMFCLRVVLCLGKGSPGIWQGKRGVP